MVDIDVSELNSLAASIEKGGLRASVKAANAIKTTAYGIERDAKVFAPVDTGNLRNSISTRISGQGLEAEIAPTADYAHYVEFGTSRMAPHAFMGPALDRNTPAFVKKVEEIAREAFE